MTTWMWALLFLPELGILLWIHVRTFGHALRVLGKVSPWKRLGLMALILLAPCVGPLIYHLIIMEWGDEYGIYQ